jgi:hypothetical protein
MRRAAAPDESHRRAVVADEGERQRRGGEIAETGTMFGGGWGRCGDLGLISPFSISPTDDFQVPQLSTINCMKSYEET